MATGGNLAIQEEPQIFTGKYKVGPGLNSIHIETVASVIRDRHDGPELCTRDFEFDVEAYGVDFITECSYFIQVDSNGYAVGDTVIDYDILPAQYQAMDAYVEITKDGVPIEYISSEEKGHGYVTISKGFQFDVNSTYKAQVVLNYGTRIEIRSDEISLFPIFVDLDAYQPGTMFSPGPIVPDSLEDNPLNLVIYDNADNDDEDPSGLEDKWDFEIGVNDDDIMTLTIRKPCNALDSGILEIRIFPEEVVRVYNPGAIGLLESRNLDFSNPSGDLFDLVFGDVDIYLEAIHPDLDVYVEIAFTTPNGNVISTDKVNFVSSFELILRRNITIAAESHFNSGMIFVPNEEFNDKMAICDPNDPYWRMQTDIEGIGITLRDNVVASDAIEHLFDYGYLFGVECLGAVIMIWYRAILWTFEESGRSDDVLDNIQKAREMFNHHFTGITFNANGSSFPEEYSCPSASGDTSFKGDARYVINPEYDLSKPIYQGENVIQMYNYKDSIFDVFFSQPDPSPGDGIMPFLGEIILWLNEHRRPDATDSAYLRLHSCRLNTIQLMNKYFSY